MLIEYRISFTHDGVTVSQRVEPSGHAVASPTHPGGTADNAVRKENYVPRTAPPAHGAHAADPKTGGGVVDPTDGTGPVDPTDGTGPVDPTEGTRRIVVLGPVIINYPGPSTSSANENGKC